MQYIGIDIGTSGTKTALYDAEGRLLASHTAEYPLHQPHNGWAEQVPEDWWWATVQGLKAVMAAYGGDAADIGGIGLAGQMHGLVMLDGDGRVLRPAILWCDQRTGEECAQITARVGEERLSAITKSPALTGFTASKILWVRNQEPDCYARCRHILLPKDYVRFRLTGTLATDVSDASGMQLLDIARRDWSPEVLEALDIDRGLLAPVYESPAVTGTVSAGAAALTGLRAGTPVVAGAGDNAAAAVGCGVVHDGTACTTIGSSGVVYAHTSRLSPDPQGRVHTFCCAVPGAWHTMGVTQAAGLSLKWFRDTLCEEECRTAAVGKRSYARLDELAASVPIGADRLLYLPYLMGERTPHLDPEARGVFLGLNPTHTRAHMVRAVMEGVAYSLRDCLEVLRETGVSVETMRACGGGGNSPLWRQMLADIFGCPVCTCVSTEGAALGAALLAAVGTGAYDTVPEACEAAIRFHIAQPPDTQRQAAYERVYAVYRQVYPALRPLFRNLAAL